MSASLDNVQVGGNHYKRYPLQPATFLGVNKIPFIPGNVVKYILRFDGKNGDEDVLKAIHYALMILDQDFGYTVDAKQVIDLIRASKPLAEHAPNKDVNAPAPITQQVAQASLEQVRKIGFNR